MAKDADPSALPPQATPPSPSEKPSGATPDEQNGSFPIVGIGASAGGLEAFTQLLQPLPSDPGLAFILVQHLDPTRESMLPELLSRVTPMLVQQVQDGMEVQPNQVYVAPPQADVVISNRVLRLISRPGTRGLHMPIDVFFRSLANDQGPHAVGIVLSGAGSDGALGLQAIKEHGGLSFVQDERTATFAGMPHSAIMHGSIDFILAPQDMAEELMQIAQHPYVADSLEADKEESTSLPLLSDREAWGQILKLLHRVKGINFTAYKPSTIQRRIARRMALHNMQQPGDYVRYLLSNREELEALYHDLFIKVTSFFRDPDSFEALKREILPRLMVDRPVHRPLRVWVPGCATGGEAYSLAIYILEFLGDEAFQESIRLFATDIDELSLAKARSGLYIENIAMDVTPERLRRFFVKVDQHYQIVRQSVRCVSSPSTISIRIHRFRIST
jgi:two-component system CheB/CheR fusion protein